MLNETESEFIDLDFDQSEAEIERPVIKDTLVAALIKSTKLDVKDTGERNLKVEFVTNQPCKSTEGKDVKEGFVFSKSYPMEDRGQMRPGQARDTLAKIHFAATGEKEGRPNTGSWMNKKVALRLAVRPERTDETSGRVYPESNEVIAVLPIK